MRSFLRRRPLLGRLPVRTATAGVAVALLAAGCSIGGGGSSKDVSAGSLAQGASLSGATLTVGGKEFTEQLVLCQMTIQALRSAGATVNEKCGLTGSSTVRTALTSGQIDMYWEYTGTAWITFLGHTTPIVDPTQQYQAVAQEDLAKNQLEWLKPAPFNNTYAIAVKETVAQQLGVKSISDYAKLAKTDPAKASLCVASEFVGRNDGLPGLEKAYGFTRPPDTATLAEGAIYNSVAKSSPCNFGEATTTDGRIKGLQLITLVDDKNFFPVYNPAVTLKKSIADANPNIAKVLNPIADALDTATVQDLNTQVDIAGKQPADVAKTWLQSKGFIGK